jgi:hypothetical protein
VISNETIDSVVVTKIGDINKSGSSLNSFITDIAIDPENKEHVLITVGFYDQTTNIYVSKTAASTNNESSFISVSGNLPQIPIYSALIEENTGVYLIGTEYGLFSSSNGGITWYQEFEGPPQCPITMIRQQTFKGSQNRGQIYVATHGRGLFTSEHYSTKADQLSNSLNVNNELSVFPNPSFDRINFELKSKANQEFIVQVVNLKGQLVFTRKQTSKFLNVSELSEGIYMLTVQANNDFYSTQFLKK